MLRVFLASHAHLSSGMKSSLEFLCGTCEGLFACDAYVEGGVDDVASALDSFFLTVEDGDRVLLLSDIYGGSVNTALYPYAFRENVTLVAGVNLAFLVELSTMGDAPTDSEIEDLIVRSRQAMQIVEAKEVGSDSVETCLSGEPDLFF
mgnify:CR=1 FL=1